MASLRRGVSAQVALALIAVLVARISTNGGFRIVYPFLPEVARGLGVSLTVIGGLLALRSVVVLVAPAVPLLAERIGRRAVMLMGVSATIVGCLAVATVGPWHILFAAVGLALTGLAKALFNIPLQGWLGERVPIPQRARVLGLTELTWALSLGLAVPAGFLIVATSWRAPFLLVAAIGIVGIVLVARFVESDKPTRRIRGSMRMTASVTALLLAVVLFRFAADSLFVVYGAWLEDDFDLAVTAIGIFTIIIVAAELLGEGWVISFADRVGIRRSVLIGLSGTAVAYGSLSFVGDSLAAGVAAVITWFAFLEVTIVSSIVLVTVLVPVGADRVLAMIWTLVVASSGLAALIGPRLYLIGGVGLVGSVSALSALTAVLIVLFKVQDGSHAKKAADFNEGVD